MKPFIVTSNGDQFWYERPYDIESIAHSLSNLCRFTGHVSEFYSVAQHSYFVGMITKSMEGLMHDAHEAFIGDLASPMKSLLPDYQKLERRIAVDMRAHFGLPLELSKEVKEADRLTLIAEGNRLLPQYEWGKSNFYFEPATPKVAFNLFMETYERFNKRGV